ncbi:MAG: glycosyltransferase family 4 protein [Pseudomonadota bacterium]
MKIAQVAPLLESVPPKYYGGTERVVSYLTEELVKQGHEVTLFASGDSITQARLVPICPTALRSDYKGCLDQLAYYFLMLEKVFQQVAEFDIVHFHIDHFHFPLARRHYFHHLTTLHGRQDLSSLLPFYEEFSEIPLVSISNAQRKPLPSANWAGTVYNGIPKEAYTFHKKQGEYLAFVGRISAHKRPDRAIEIAKRVGMPLKIAAKLDDYESDYFKSKVEPFLDDSSIEFVGEIGEDEKDAFFGNAYATIFPIDWPEPFGLVMIESMACGTPVIAFQNGAVPEVMEDKKTGFIVNIAEQL